MATKPRESASGREKRGTSPSQSTHQHRRSPPSKTSSPAKNQDSTASEKQIPNYLKPTKSSGNDVSKPQGKKLAPNDGAHKPNLTRRRSFDKPPSPSRTQRTRVSPSPTLRSASFSSKTTTVHKSIPDKYSKASKDAGKQSSLYARPVSTIKKSSTNIKKQDIASSDSTTKEQDTITPEKVDPSNIYDVPQPETKLKDQESPIAEESDKDAEESDKDAEEETFPVGGNNEVRAEVFVLEDPEPIAMGQTEVESNKDAQPEIFYSSTVSEQQDASLGVKTEEQENKSQIEETSSNHQELEEQSLYEINNSKTDEIIADNLNAEVEEKEGEHGEIESDKKEVAAGESEAQESTETAVAAEEKHEAENVAAEEKHEAENVAAKKQGTHGKKDSAVSNDVIEETASKLREQRKNKVKALAGAFETVISLQESK